MRILFMTFFFLCSSCLIAQTIKLDAIWIDCLVFKQLDSILYKPVEISLHLRLKNNTSNSVFIISDSKYLKKQPELGYIEFRFKDKEPFRFKSEFTICVLDSIEFPLYANSFFPDEKESDYDYGKYSVLKDNLVSLPPKDSYLFSYFPNQFESFNELYEEILINSTLHYKCIKEDYKLKECNSLFPSTEVVMDDYFINLVDGGETLKVYYVKDKKGTLVESF